MQRLRVRMILSACTDIDPRFLYIPYFCGRKGGGCQLHIAFRSSVHFLPSIHQGSGECSWANSHTQSQRRDCFTLFDAYFCGVDVLFLTEAACLADANSVHPQQELGPCTVDDPKRHGGKRMKEERCLSLDHFRSEWLGFKGAINRSKLFDRRLIKADDDPRRTRCFTWKSPTRRNAHPLVNTALRVSRRIPALVVEPGVFGRSLSLYLGTCRGMLNMNVARFTQL